MTATLSQARTNLQRRVDQWSDEARGTWINVRLGDLRALLAETRGDEGFSPLGGKPPSSGTEQASEPADHGAYRRGGPGDITDAPPSRELAGDMVERVARAVHAHRFDGAEVWDGDDCECEQVKAEFRYEAAEHLDALFGGRAFVEYVLAQDVLSPAVEGPKT